MFNVKRLLAWMALFSLLVSMPLSARVAVTFERLLSPKSVEAAEPTSPNPELTIDLDWSGPVDLESRLLVPLESGNPWQYIISDSDLGNSSNYPYAIKDSDADGSSGHERITISQVLGGCYYYAVRAPGGFECLDSSTAITVTVTNSQNQMLLSEALQLSPSSSGDWWHVFTLEWLEEEASVIPLQQINNLELLRQVVINPASFDVPRSITVSWVQAINTSLVPGLYYQICSQSDNQILDAGSIVETGANWCSISLTTDYAVGDYLFLLFSQDPSQDGKLLARGEFAVMGVNVEPVLQVWPDLVTDQATSVNVRLSDYSGSYDDLTWVLWYDTLPENCDPLVATPVVGQPGVFSLELPSWYVPGEYLLGVFAGQPTMPSLIAGCSLKLVVQSPVAPDVINRYKLPIQIAIPFVGRLDGSEDYIFDYYIAPSGSPLADFFLSPIAGVATQPAGEGLTLTLPADLPSGEYAVLLICRSYEGYGDGIVYFTVTDVPVLAGTVKYDDVSGRRFPIQGANVSVLSADNEVVTSATTDVNGCYELFPPYLNPGEYTLKISAGRFITQSLSLTLPLAQSLNTDIVLEPQTKLTISLFWADLTGGAPSSHLLVPLGGQAASQYLISGNSSGNYLEYPWVGLYSQANSEQLVLNELLPGKYRFSVSAPISWDALDQTASLSVEVADQSGSILLQCSLDRAAANDGSNWWHVFELSVASDQTLQLATLDTTDEQPLHRIVSVQPTIVTVPNQVTVGLENVLRPILLPNLCFRIYNSSQNMVEFGSLGLLDQHQFSLSVGAGFAPGDYQICIYDRQPEQGGQLLARGAFAVTDVQGLPTSISGQVTSLSGERLAGAQVTIYDLATDLIAGESLTDSDGYYTITDLPPGSYLVEAGCTASDGLPYAPRFYSQNGGVYLPELAEPVETDPGQTISNINLELEPSGYISGRVAGGNYERINGPVVSAARLLGTNHEGEPIFEPICRVTGNELGEYLVLVPEGTYVLSAVSDTGTDPAFAETWYGSVYGPDFATRVQVDAGTTVAEVFFQLRAIHTISGVIRDETGQPLANVPVIAYDTAYPEKLQITAYTDQTGAYQLRVPCYYYKLRTNALGAQLPFVDEWYDNARDIDAMHYNPCDIDFNLIRLMKLELATASFLDTELPARVWFQLDPVALYAAGTASFDYGIYQADGTSVCSPAGQPIVSGQKDYYADLPANLAPGAYTLRLYGNEVFAQAEFCIIRDSSAAGALQEINDAADVAAMKEAIERHASLLEIGLDTYKSLSDKNAVIQCVFSVKPHATASALKTVFDAAVTEQANVEVATAAVVAVEATTDNLSNQGLIDAATTLYQTASDAVAVLAIGTVRDALVSRLSVVGAAIEAAQAAIEPPAITFSGVQDGAFYQVSVAPSWNISEGASITSLLLSRNGAQVEGWHGGQIGEDGVYRLVVVATRTVNGVSGSGEVSFTIDRLKPDVSVDITDGWLTKFDVTPTFAVTDNHEGATVTATLQKNDQDAHAFASGTTVSNEGTYALVMNMTDAAGNTNSRTVNFEIDKTSPSITVTGVADSQIATGFNIGFNATDRNLMGQAAIATLQKDGADPVAFTGGEVVEPGQYLLVVTAVDLAGNTATETISFIVDSCVSAIDVTLDNSGLLWAGETTHVTIWGTVYVNGKPTGGLQVDATIQAPSGVSTMLQVVSGTEGVYQITYVVPQAESEGQYTVTVSCGIINAQTRFATIEIAQPVSTLLAGSYVGTQIVTLTTGTDGAVVRYTTDGSAPDINSAGGGEIERITVSSSMTIRAIAVKNGVSTAPVTFLYTITAPYIPDIPPVNQHEPVIGAGEMSSNVAITDGSDSQVITTVVTVDNALLEAAANSAREANQPVVIALPATMQPDDPQTTTDGRPISHNARLSITDQQLSNMVDTGLSILGPQGTTVELPMALLTALSNANTGLELDICRVPNDVAQSSLNEWDEALFAQEINTNFSGATTLRFLAPEGADVVSLKVKVNHSDGTVEDLTPDIITGEDGRIYLEITVGRFSTFIVYNPGQPIVQPTTVVKLTIGAHDSTINGESCRLDAVPFVTESGRTLVPVRFISEALGARVAYESRTKTVHITDGIDIWLTLGSNVVTIDGQRQIIDARAELVSGIRTFVPLRFIGEALGAKVHYDPITKEISITR